MAMHKQKLLGFENAKTVKGEKYNYQTAIIYLASHKESGYNVCAEASEQCSEDCLYLSGFGGFKFTQEARVKKTKRYFESFKDVQFYDYTVINKRMTKYLNGGMPSNYHLTYSRKEDNHFQVMEALNNGANVSVVFEKYLPKTWNGFKVINGDETDLRFLDKSNVVVGLTAKGKAKIDNSGFVVRAV